MNGLKKTLAVGSFASNSTFGTMTSHQESSQTTEIEVSSKCQEVISSRIINQTDENLLTKIFQDRFETMTKTKIGAAVLKELPGNVNYIIARMPMDAEEAGYWDGKNCTIYDDTILSSIGGSPALIAHETRHAIQGIKYAQDYVHMPTEQQIAYEKMIEVETRLQDVLMKEELYAQNAPGTRSYTFATADWTDYRRIKTNIAKVNPNLSADQVERMAKTQFVMDTWQGNYQKKEYDQQDRTRSFTDWIRTYNEHSLQLTNPKRCWAIRPLPDMTVDESLTEKHHKNAQEFISRMGVDVPTDFFDDLKYDKSLRVVRNPQELAIISKHFGRELKMAIIPRDDFVRVGGMVVSKDNSTLIFDPKKRKELEKEIQETALVNQARQILR